MINLERLSEYSVFGGIKDEDLKLVARLLVEKEYQSGEIIIKEGDVGQDIFVIEDGEVDILKRVERFYEKKRVATLKDGECFGEMALLDIQPRSASVVAKRNTRVLCIPHKQLFDLYNINLQLYMLIMMNLGREISRRLRRADDTIVYHVARSEEGYQPLIFDMFPGLKGRLPWIPLGRFPTPVEKLDKLGEKIGLKNLYIKRDDLSSNIYGGNKVRKYEFLLPYPLGKGSKTLITIGAIGSNHALATTVYGRRLGKSVVNVMFPQPMAEYVKRNLLLNYKFGAELFLCPSVYLIPFYTVNTFLRQWRKDASIPYYIPSGATSEVGCSGYVSASIELKMQVEDRLIPEPDYIFVPIGTCGTSAGLQVGLKAMGMKTKVISVRVVDKLVCNSRRLSALINKTSKFLNKLDSNFPKFSIPSKELIVLENYFGGEYARFTKEGMEAVRLMKSFENIELEGTYTGKTLAGLIDYCKKNGLHDKVILFWNTHNSIDLSHLVEGFEHKELPKSFHKFFALPNQELDDK